MPSEGVSTYLLLVDPDTHVITWANENVEEANRARMGVSAVGQKVQQVIYLGQETGAIDLIDRVAESGESRHLNTRTFSATGEGSRNNASFHRLPTGQVLVAAEWIRDALTEP